LGTLGLTTIIGAIYYEGAIRRLVEIGLTAKGK
jgi:hypothetical protein